MNRPGRISNLIHPERAAICPQLATLHRCALHAPRAVAQNTEAKSAEIPKVVNGAKVSQKTLTQKIPRVPMKDTLHGKDVEERALQACLSAIETDQRGGSNRRVGMGGSSEMSSEMVESAYERCGKITEFYAKTFYLGTKLMTPEKQRAIWAIYVWCRRTDELVDGPNASRITPAALDKWEDRLEAIFDGRPYDTLDAALAETVKQFPVHIQPFRDMIGGMRMDLNQKRWETYDSLYEYCYRVAGAVGLMTLPVMGMAEDYNGPLEPVVRAALSLGTANQLTNILRDVGEDFRARNRIYVPQDELKDFGITEADFTSEKLYPSPVTHKVDPRWEKFMKMQIERAREVFHDAERGVPKLHADARWPVWSALIIYREILDAIEANSYDNLTKRAYVPRARKLLLLPNALARAVVDK